MGISRVDEEYIIWMVSRGSTGKKELPSRIGPACARGGGGIKIGPHMRSPNGWPLILRMNAHWALLRGVIFRMRTSCLIGPAFSTHESQFRRNLGGGVSSALWIYAMR